MPLGASRLNFLTKPAVVAGTTYGTGIYGVDSDGGTADFDMVGLFDSSGYTALTVSIWVYVNAYTSGNLFFFEDYGGGSYGLPTRLDVDGGWICASSYDTSTSRKWFAGYNQNNAKITAGGNLGLNQWIHVLYSFDSQNYSSNPPRLYINDTLIPNFTTPNANWTIETDPNHADVYKGDNFGFGGRSGGGLSPDASYSDCWMHPSYIDLSVTGNRRDFITAGGAPADLGNDGSNPGVTPMNYFSGPVGDFNTQRGTGNAVKDDRGTWLDVDGPAI